MGWVGWGDNDSVYRLSMNSSHFISPSPLFGICKLQTSLGSYSAEQHTPRLYKSPLSLFLTFFISQHPIHFLCFRNILKNLFSVESLYSLYCIFYLFNGILRDKEELKLFCLPHWSRCLDTCQFLKFISLFWKFWKIFINRSN